MIDWFQGTTLLNNTDLINQANSSGKAVLLNFENLSISSWEDFVSHLIYSVFQKNNNPQSFKEIGNANFFDSGTCSTRALDGWIEYDSFSKQCQNLLGLGDYHTLISLCYTETNDHFDKDPVVYWHHHGDCLWVVNGQEFDLKVNDILYVPAKAVHSVKSSPMRAGVSFQYTNEFHGIFQDHMNKADWKEFLHSNSEIIWKDYFKVAVDK